MQRPRVLPSSASLSCACIPAAIQVQAALPAKRPVSAHLFHPHLRTLNLLHYPRSHLCPKISCEATTEPSCSTSLKIPTLKTPTDWVFHPLKVPSSWVPIISGCLQARCPERIGYSVPSGCLLAGCLVLSGHPGIGTPPSLDGALSYQDPQTGYPTPSGCLQTGYPIPSGCPWAGCPILFGLVDDD